eukprot:Lankesteria_metandrocarpae@DN572_c0_g1_i1.p1
MPEHFAVNLGVDCCGGSLLWAESESRFADGYEGSRLWEAGAVLARELLTKDVLAEARVCLELGCGVGLCAAGIAKFAKTRPLVYFATDKANILLSAQQSFVKNGIVTKSFEMDLLPTDLAPDIPIVFVAPLVWGVTPGKDSWWEVCIAKKVDVLVGSDLIFGGVDLERLAGTIDILLSENGHAYLCSPETRNGLLTFDEAMKKLNFETDMYTVSQDTLQPLVDCNSPHPPTSRLDQVKNWMLGRDIDNNFKFSRERDELVRGLETQKFVILHAKRKNTTLKLTIG